MKFKVLFVKKIDLEKNIFDIEESEYRDYLRQFGGDETTTPRGVAPRLHLRENSGGEFELWSWGTSGNHPYKIDTFETEEEAESELFECFENYISHHNWDAPPCFPDIDALAEYYAEVLELSKETLLSYINHYLIYQFKIIERPHNSEASYCYQQQDGYFITDKGTCISPEDAEKDYVMEEILYTP